MTFIGFRWDFAVISTQPRSGVFSIFQIASFQGLTRSTKRRDLYKISVKVLGRNDMSLRSYERF